MAIVGSGTRFQYYDPNSFPTVDITNPGNISCIRLISKIFNNENITFKSIGSTDVSSIAVSVVGDNITVTYVLKHGAYLTSTVQEVVDAINNSTAAKAKINALVLWGGDKPMFDKNTIKLEKFVSISDITNITGPALTMETTDITTFDSVSGCAEFMPTTRNTGQVTLTILYDKKEGDIRCCEESEIRETETEVERICETLGHEYLKQFYETESEQLYRIFLPDVDGTRMKFQGRITEMPLTIPVDEKVTFDVTIQATSIMTLEPV